MDIISFENALKFDTEWNDELTEEEFDFIMEQVSYMSDRDRAFYYKIIHKIMGQLYDKF